MRTSASQIADFLGRLLGKARLETSQLWLRAPVELKTLLVFIAIWTVGVAVGLPVSLPDSNSLRFVERHYFRPLIAALFIQIVVGIMAARGNGAKMKEKQHVLLFLLPFMVVSVFLHFNFKAWMPLVNPKVYDEIYQWSDLLFIRVLDSFIWIRNLVAPDGSAWVDLAYQYGFIVMFFVSFSAHAFLNDGRTIRRLVYGVCLILLVGSLCYWIAPAEGPFIYREGLNKAAISSQLRMHEMFFRLQETSQIPDGYFASPPAAMPSLHLAHAVLFLWFAWRHGKLLLPLYIPITGWICIEAAASAWHYLIDLPAGLLVFLACREMLDRWLPEDRPVCGGISPGLGVKSRSVSPEDRNLECQRHSSPAD